MASSMKGAPLGGQRLCWKGPAPRSGTPFPAVGNAFAGWGSRPLSSPSTAPRRYACLLELPVHLPEGTGPQHLAAPLTQALAGEEFAHP